MLVTGLFAIAASVEAIAASNPSAVHTRGRWPELIVRNMSRVYAEHLAGAAEARICHDEGVPCRSRRLFLTAAATADSPVPSRSMDAGSGTALGGGGLVPYVKSSSEKELMTGFPVRVTKSESDVMPAVEVNPKN